MKAFAFLPVSPFVLSMLAAGLEGVVESKQGAAARPLKEIQKDCSQN